MWASLLLLGGLWLGQPAPEAPAKGENLELQVRQLVRQLDAAELAGREAAEARLLELGPAALEYLPEPGPRASAEVRQRVARIRQKLQQAAAESATTASTVTLQVTEKPAFEVLAEIARQTGNKIVDARQQLGQAEDEPPAVSASLDKTPFWPALDEVLDKAELTVYPYAEEAAVISVVGRPPTRLPRQVRAAYSGPFRLEPLSVSAQQDLRELVHSSLQITMEVAWEPRLRPISLRLPMASVQATDLEGRPLEADLQQAELEVPVTAESIAAELSIPMKLPSRDVKQIGRLRGTLQAMLPGKIEEFRFDDVLKVRGVSKRIGGVTVTLDEVRRNRDIWEARVRVRFDEAGAALESHRDSIFQNEAFLLAPGGKEPIGHDAMETTLQEENEVGVAYLFYLEKPPAGHTLVYKTPGTVLTTEFPFQLEKIELP